MRGKCIQRSTHVAHEHQAACSRSDSAHDGKGCLEFPLDRTAVRVDGVNPASPGCRRIELAEGLTGIRRVVAGPGLVQLGVAGLVLRLQCDRRTPVDRAGEQQVGRRIVGGPVPFRAALGTGAKVHRLLRKRRVCILDARHGGTVQAAAAHQIEGMQMAVFRRNGNDPLATLGRQDNGCR